MRSTMTTVAATLLSLWGAACAVPIATCTDDDDCPGELVCDEPTGVCALADRGPQQEGERTDISEGQAPADDAPAPEEEAPSAEAPPEDAPPESAPPDDDGGDGNGNDDQCLALEEECSFDDDACCEHTHCCPVFLICVPNFWE